LTSTFAVSGESAAESLIKSFNPNMFGMKKAFSMHGMVQKPMCAFHIPQHYIRALEGMLAREAPDSEYLRISRDYIRETVAHEIGHTLGLRHNFAGSLGASYSLDQREAIVHAYVTQQILPDNLQPSSSVMDYQVFEEAAMTGQIIAKTQRMLDYDKAAMEALYSGKKFAIDEVPAFCTDSQTDNLDCQTFDLGKTPVEFSAWTIKQYQKNLSKDLFAVILQAKKLGVAPKFEASAWASYLAADRYQILGLLANKTSLIQVRRKFTSRDDVASQQITQEESSLLQAALAKIGGWQGLLALPSQADWALVSAAVKQNMSSYSAIDKDGQSSGFSFEEQKKYGDLIDGFLQRLDLELAVDQWTNLSQIAPIGENIFADEFIAWLRDESSRLILSTEGTVKAERHLDDGTRVELILPVFKTVGALRGLVVSTLAGLAGKAQWKLSAGEENIYDHLSELLEASIPEQSTIKYRDLDVVAQEWRANQQALMTSLRN
ncbi:MAG: zinc-dependent metalloprotease, partial [Proteobacteria bacterium]|nr:zinc-dependent metalloprotease [Pseudomonadota bacterium]